MPPLPHGILGDLRNSENQKYRLSILISSAISAPIDQALFLWLASQVVPGMFALGSVVTGIVSKLVGAYVVSRLVAAQERRIAPQTA